MSSLADRIRVRAQVSALLREGSLGRPILRRLCTQLGMPTRESITGSTTGYLNYVINVLGVLEAEKGREILEGALKDARFNGLPREEIDLLQETLGRLWLDEPSPPTTPPTSIPNYRRWLSDVRAQWPSIYSYEELPVERFLVIFRRAAPEDPELPYDYDYADTLEKAKETCEEAALGYVPESLMDLHTGHIYDLELVSGQWVLKALNDDALPTTQARLVQQIVQRTVLQDMAAKPDHNAEADLAEPQTKKEAELTIRQRGRFSDI